MLFWSFPGFVESHCIRSLREVVVGVGFIARPNFPDEQSLSEGVT